MNKTSKKENGQIIVLLSLSLIVVMVVAALAVDGGMIYSERRFVQNSADAASLAAGGTLMFLNIDNDNFSCPINANFDKGSGKFNNTNIIEKTYNSARNVALINNISDLPFLGYIRNGTTVANDSININGNHGVIIECDDTHIQKTINVTVRITSEISTAFLHLISQDDLKTTNESEVVVEPGAEGSYGLALVTLGKECKLPNSDKCGIYLSSSNATLKITGAGAYGSNCLIIDNGKTQDQLKVEKGFKVVCSKEEMLDESQWPPSDSSEYDWLFGNIDFDNPPAIDPNPTKPDCSQYTKTSKWKDVNLLDVKKGKYDEIKINNNTVNFEPGLYCVYGDISINAGIVDGEGVTFYQPAGKNFSITGGDIDLSAPTDQNDPNQGLLVYIDGEAKSITLNGNAETYFSGMFYAPKSWLNILGTNNVSTTYASQFIVEHVTIGGGGVIEIIYNKDSVASRDPKMYIVK